MVKGFYTAAMGMISQQRKMDMLTNNLSNAQTPGYKAEQGSLRAFPQLLMRSYTQQTIPDHSFGFEQGTVIGRINSGVYMQEQIFNMNPGTLKETTLPTDVALVEGLIPTDEETGQQGALFFTIMAPNGDIYYTRNGNFHLNANNELVTSQGFYVLDTNNQPIQVQTPEFTIRSNGTIFENDQQTTQMNIAYSNNPNTLIKVDTGIFQAPDNQALQEVPDGATFSLYQGFLEGSNVDLAQTSVDMMSAYRLFEANQKALQAYDQTLEMAVNQIGKVN